MVLVSPAYWGWSNLDFVKRAALWTMMQLAPGARLTGRGLNIRPSDNEKVLVAMGQDPFVIKATRIDATHGLVDLMDAAWKEAPRLAVPTLVLYADGDEVVPSRPIEAAARAAQGPTRLVCYDDGFHMLLRDLKARRTWEEVANFVRDPRVAASASAVACRH